MLKKQRNDILYTLYESENVVLEDGHSKKVKTRHNKKKKNIENRFYNNMNYKHSHTDKEGNKHGTVKRGDGPEVPITIHKKSIPAHCKGGMKVHDGEDHFKIDSHIHMSRSDVQIKGSDITGSHEYAHSMDNEKIVNSVNSNKKVRDILKLNIPDEEKEKLLKKAGINKVIKKAEKEINNSDGFDKLSKSAIKKNKIKNEHDKQANEMRADYYANTTTKGENNTNRYRKHINETSRRGNQQYDSENKRAIRKIDKDIKDNRKELKRLDKLNDDIDQGHVSPLKKAGAKSLLTTGRVLVKANKKSSERKRDKIKKYNNDVTKSNKRDSETRKKTNDYIMKKKKEESN